jgi:hypothetical protein
MRVLFATVALTLGMGSTPTFAGDQGTECFSGQYREALCHPRIWHRDRTVVIDEREPDVIMLPYAPYVVVNWPHK